MFMSAVDEKELQQLRDGEDVKSRSELLAHVRELYAEEQQAAKYLMIAHAAGLVTTLTLLKDYKDGLPIFKGIGTFVLLFSGGLAFAIGAYAANMIAQRRAFVFVRHGIKRMLGSAQTFYAIEMLVSIAQLIVAIFIAAFRFSD
jgi:hypothetical protein